MKHGVVLVLLLLGHGSLLATEFALVHQRDEGRQKVLQINADGSFAPSSTGAIDCCQVPGAVGAGNSGDGVIYAVGGALGSAPDQLYTLSALNGAQQNAAQLPVGIQPFYLAYDGTGQRLLAAAVNQATSSMQLYQVDPGTGVFTPLGLPNPGCCVVRAGVGAYDASSNRIAVIARTGSDMNWRLYLFDSNSGSLLSNVELTTIAAPDFLGYDGNGTLYAVYHESATSTELVVTLDPITGATFTVGSGQSDCCVVAAGTALMRSSDLLLVARGLADAQYALYSVDLAGGGFTALQTIDGNLAVSALVESAIDPGDDVLFEDGFEDLPTKRKAGHSGAVQFGKGDDPALRGVGLASIWLPAPMAPGSTSPPSNDAQAENDSGRADKRTPGVLGPAAPTPVPGLGPAGGLALVVLLGAMASRRLRPRN